MNKNWLKNLFGRLFRSDYCFICGDRYNWKEQKGIVLKNFNSGWFSVFYCFCEDCFNKLSKKELMQKFEDYLKVTVTMPKIKDHYMKEFEKYLSKYCTSTIMYPNYKKGCFTIKKEKIKLLESEGE